MRTTSHMRVCLEPLESFRTLEEGKQTHALVLKTGYASNVLTQNGLVSMYARCGMIDDSKQVFFSMSGPNLVSWNSLLSGCARHEYFDLMRYGNSMVSPRAEHYACVVDLLCRAGYLGEAESFIETRQ